MLLFYLRHGDPIYNPDSLTPLGEKQADALAKRLAVYGIDKIYSSTSNRAYQTALPTATLTKKEVTKIDFFNEGHAWGYFAVPSAAGYTTWAEEQQEFRRLFVSREIYNLGDKWYEHPRFSEYKFGEGVDYYNRSIDGFMLTLGYEHDRETKLYKALRPNHERVAIFAHGGFGGVFLSSVLDMPYPQFVAHHSLSHTGMTVIHFESEGEEIIPSIYQFGNDSHLYKEGLPTYHCNAVPI